MDMNFFFEETCVNMTTAQPEAKAPKPPQTLLKIWLGGSLSGWLRCLVRNRFAVDARHLPLALLITLALVFTSVGRGLQTLRWGRRVRQTQLKQAPLFVIGHWRNGTTLLHELLALDDRYTSPTTYQCFNPGRFLCTKWLDMRLFGFLLPRQRPFDNMAVGWDRPQEDEFALMNLGVPSPYEKILFPRREPCPEYYDLEGLAPRELRQWKQTLLSFLKAVTAQVPKRVILKSPTHTYRLKVLREMFPDAQFVHIVRNPYVVFASTMRMWRGIMHQQGLQAVPAEGLEEYVYKEFLHMHEKLVEARPLIPESCWHELRYEDLVADPIGQLRLLYGKLGLGAFDAMVPRVQQYLEATAEYQTNRHELAPALLSEITRRWGYVIDQYGYARLGPTHAPGATASPQLGQSDAGSA